MRAVWSFWPKPFYAHHMRVWLSDCHHLLAWVLSVESASRHYPRTTLVTDDEGARLLVDGLGLEFTTVTTELNALRDADPEWWVLGKLWAYRSQKEPFVHVDNDVFLWKRLPPKVERAGVCAQNPECFPLTADSWYRPAAYEQVIRSVSGWVPDEWRWSTSRKFTRAICCGILGGTAVDFLSYYADLAIRMIGHPRNCAAWHALGSPIGDNILFEQYLLAACLEFHRDRQGSPYRKVDAAYLFESTEQAFDEACAARIGYTHLIGGAKSDPGLMARLDARVRRDYPERYQRCRTLCGSGGVEDDPGPWPAPAPGQFCSRSSAG